MYLQTLPARRPTNIRCIWLYHVHRRDAHCHGQQTVLGRLHYRFQYNAYELSPHFHHQTFLVFDGRRWSDLADQDSASQSTYIWYWYILSVFIRVYDSSPYMWKFYGPHFKDCSLEFKLFCSNCASEDVIDRQAMETYPVIGKVCFFAHSADVVALVMVWPGPMCCSRFFCLFISRYSCLAFNAHRSVVVEKSTSSLQFPDNPATWYLYYP